MYLVQWRAPLSSRGSRPSHRHLSLITDPACNQILELGRKYSNLISLHFLATIDVYVPVRFPPLNHFPRLELMSNETTLLPANLPLERLYLHDISIKWLLELIPKLLEGNPKHLRLIYFDNICHCCIRNVIGDVSLWSLNVLAIKVDNRQICLRDRQDLDLSAILRERG